MGYHGLLLNGTCIAVLCAAALAVLLVGLLLHHGLVWCRDRGWSRPAGVVLGVLFLAYAARTATRVPDRRSDETLNLATAEAFPETPVPYLNLAT